MQLKITRWLNFLFMLVALGCAGRPQPEIAVAAPQSLLPLKIQRVIDGDSLALDSGEELRLAGVNAPEWDAPLGEAAKKFVSAQIDSHRIFWRPCEAEPRDKYHRLLGWVSVERVDLQMQLLEAGLAVPMIIEPCGLENLQKYAAAARAARDAKRGVWKEIVEKPLKPSEAGDHFNEYVEVKGRVLNVHAGPKTLHLNFGKNWRKDFSVTIFRRDLANFRAAHIDPEKYYAGREIRVDGYLKKYGGPEMIVYTPEQIH